VSWLRSFGHEKSQKTEGAAIRLADQKGRRNEGAKVSARYTGWPSDDEPNAINKQVRYALTERLDWWMRRMLEHKQARSVGNDLQIDPILQIVLGRSKTGHGVYVLGEKPITAYRVDERTGRRHRTTYDPHRVDWGEREMVLRKQIDEALTRTTNPAGQLRALLAEADRCFTKDADRWPKI